MRYLSTIIIVLLLSTYSKPCIAADASQAQLNSSSKSEPLQKKESLNNLRDKVNALLAQKEAIQNLFQGVMPDKLYSTELFLVDLGNEEAIKNRIAELQNFLESPNIANIPDSIGITTETIKQANLKLLEQYEASLNLKIAQLSLTFLKKPLAARTSLLEAEKQAQAQAKAAEEAEKAKLLALEQQSKAEEAQRLAILEATKAKDIESKAIANEKVKAESIQAALAKLKTDILSRASSIADIRTQKSSRIFEQQELVRKATPNSEEAANLYDKIIIEVEKARNDLAASLDNMQENSQLPEYKPTDFTITNDNAEDIKNLKNTALTIQSTRSEIQNLLDKIKWEEAVYTENYASQLNKSRLVLLAKLPEEKRSTVLGIHAEGRNQFWREVTHITLLTRWTLLSSKPKIHDLLELLHSPFAMAALIFKIVILCIIIIVSRFISQRGVGWVNLLRTYIATSMREPTLRKLLLSVFASISTIWNEVIFLSALQVIPAFFPNDVSNPLFATILAILMSIAWYKLVMTSSYNIILWLSSTSLGAMPAKRKSKIIKSIYLVGRFTLYLIIYLTISEAILGKGYLYHIATRFGWLGAFPIILTLISWWRTNIIEAYLARKTTGAFADALRKTQTAWYGFFVAMLAVTFMFIIWLGISAQRFALSFEHTRKALAYLFRRRLEKQAEENVIDIVKMELPEKLKEALKTTPVSNEEFILDRFPKLDDFIQDTEEWFKNNSRIGAWLIVGRIGLGKTSWMNVAAMRINFMPVITIPLSYRLKNSSEVISCIGAAINSESKTTDEIIASLLLMPKGMIVIDNLQNMVLRSVGHLEAWDTLCTIIERTGHHIYWLGACTHYSYEFLEWARKSKDVFRNIVNLSKWSESEIRELLEVRTNYSGYRIVYDDLVVHGNDAVNNHTQLISTAQEYARLIWDYSEGCPRVALQCWADSLLPVSKKTMQVRLFERPDLQLLENLEESQRFILASVLWHENSNIEESSLSLRYTKIKCEDSLRQLNEDNILFKSEDNRYRISTKWLPFVIRYLRRKHLIES